MKNRTKKVMMASVLTAALGLGTATYLMRPTQDAMQLLAGKRATGRPQTAATVATGSAPPQSKSRGSTVSAALATAAKAGATANPATANATKVNYNLSDGQYTGNRIYVFYGYVRVQADIQNGKISNVHVLEHPNDNGTSRYINSIAMPYLVQEAVQSQTANISLISGATLSSEGFVKSLYKALK